MNLGLVLKVAYVRSIPLLDLHEMALTLHPERSENGVESRCTLQLA